MSDTSSRPHTCPDAPDNRKYALSHSKTVAHYNNTDDSHQSTSPKRHGVLAIASAITSNWKKHRSKSTVPPSQYDDQDNTDHNPTMPPTARSDKDRTTPRKEKRRGRVFSTNSTITNLSHKLHHTQKPPKIYHMHNDQHATFDYTTAPVPWTQYPGLAVQDAMSTLLEESGSSNDLYNKTIIPTKTRKRVSLTNLRSIFANENDPSIDEQSPSAHHTNTSPRKHEDTTPENQPAQLSPLKRAFRRRSMADLKNAITGNGSGENLTINDSSSLPQDKSTNSSKKSPRKVSSSSTKTRTSSGNYSAAQLSKKVDDLETQLETARRELADALENPHAQTIPDDIPPIPILSAETRTKLEADALARSGTSKKRQRDSQPSNPSSPSHKLQKLNTLPTTTEQAVLHKAKHIMSEIPHLDASHPANERIRSQPRKMPSSRSLYHAGAEIPTILEADEPVAMTPLSTKSFEWPEDVF